MNLRAFLRFMPQLLGLSMAFFLTSQSSFSAPDTSLAFVLDPIRAKYHLPALAGAIFTTDGVVEMAAVGVRKAGTTIPVTTDDLWHLGSDTKAMTATLAGTFVAEKKLSWGDKVVSFFPEIRDKVPQATRNITVGQVLAHQAGLSNVLSLTFSPTWNLRKQRFYTAETALQSAAYAPGSFHYSNFDYIVVGVILEKMSGLPWEDLMRQRIFQPLGMDSAGFRGTGTPGKIDEPWPHSADGTPTPANGPDMDLPEILGPAGGIHCTMADWAKFLADQLRGGTGMKALLPDKIYQAMQTAAPHSDSGYGWGVFEKPWAGGKALSHTGSNGMNYCVCWLAPGRKFGVLVVCNQGGDAAAKATDDAASALILRYLAKLKAQP